MNKSTAISHLLEYFNNDISLFVTKVDINIEKYLNCLNATEIKEIYKSTLTNSVNSTPKPQTTKLVSKSTTTTIQPYLPFDSERPTIDINKRINEMTKAHRINTRQRNLMILAQLFKDDIIKDIKIIQPLSLRDDTLIYIGKQGSKKVVVKVQPSNNPKYNFRLTNFSYQVTTERHFYSQIKKYNLNTIPKFYYYGCVEPLNPLTDIERYILVTELLGDNLTILKNKPVSLIINSVLLALKTIQSLHSCGIKSTPKESFVHKDVKHENFVFTDDTMTNVKVIDFGLTESLYDSQNNRKIFKDSYSKAGEGTPLYMSTMQHKLSIHDYMDDLQAFAWMLLDLLGNQPISLGMPWYNATTNDERLEMKLEFIERCKDPIYTHRLANGTLTTHNIAIIGELAKYTIKTDLKNKDNLYYTIYNEQHYKDIETIIKKLR